MLKFLYELLKTARARLLALESHVSNSHDGAIFNKYPLISKNHHVTEFICGALSTVIDGSASPQQLATMLDKEIQVMEEEHHLPLHALRGTADALPGFGIVAAVLGIVITMGAISGPVEEIGHSVGAAARRNVLGYFDVVRIPCSARRADRTGGVIELAFSVRLPRSFRRSSIAFRRGGDRTSSPRFDQ